MKESVIFYEPNEIKGFILLRIKYWDINKADDSYAYIPALRRVRRLTGADDTDPLLGTDATTDDFEVFRQKFDSRMKFRILEQRDFLVPRTYVGMENIPAYYDHKKYGPCPQVEWEIRPFWVLEIMINNPDYAYSKRVLYVDAVPLDQGGSYLLSWGEFYDQKGRLWKAGGMGAMVANKKGFKTMFNGMYMNYQTDHYTAMDISPGYVNKDFGKIFPLKEEEVFSIKGLLKRAR